MFNDFMLTFAQIRWSIFLNCTFTAHYERFEKKGKKEKILVWHVIEKCTMAIKDIISKSCDELSLLVQPTIFIFGQS